MKIKKLSRATVAISKARKAWFFLFSVALLVGVGATVHGQSALNGRDANANSSGRLTAAVQNGPFRVTTLTPEDQVRHRSDKSAFPSRSRYLDASNPRLFAKLSPNLAWASQLRQLSLAERVACQRAIEEVYWRHRIWPKERPDPKPPLDQVITPTQIRHKVENYLRDSQALEDYWQRPITAEDLQTEMDRMATHTNQPEVLHELFAALNNDPTLIAECLARPALSESWQIKAEDKTVKLIASRAADYTLPTVSETQNRLAQDVQTAASTTNPQTVTISCINENWTRTTTTNAPSAREYHTAIWTGSEMIVWGGTAGLLNTGGRYNPATDTWTATSTINAPSARAFHTAVWTGSEMIVWGGEDYSSVSLNTGGRYNASTDTWTAVNSAGAPSARFLHTAVWTGSKMIVWGGLNNNGPISTGGRYNRATDSWTTSSNTNAPTARYFHSTVWTGSEMIVWGGVGNGIAFDTGGRYNPVTNHWTSTTTTNAPTARNSPTAIWTGSEMIVWGGFANNGVTNTGGRYNLGTDSWTATSTSNSPSARFIHTAVWTGNEMVVWGGQDNGSLLNNTGGRYCAQLTPTPTPGGTACTSNVVRLSQGDPRWACDFYDHSTDCSPSCNLPSNECSIQNLGCALTSLTMAMNETGLVNSDPGMVNALLKTHIDGYSAGGVNWGPATAYASGNNTLHFRETRIKSITDLQAAKAYLDNALCQIGKPVIVGVYSHPDDPNGQACNVVCHFVVVKGTDGAGTYSIADPGNVNNITLSAYGNRFETRGYVSPSGTEAPSEAGRISEVVITAGGNVNLLVLDPAGEATGMDSTSGGIVEEIPNSLVFVDTLDNDVTDEVATQRTQSVYIRQAPAGNYQIRLIPLSDGPFRITMSQFSDNGIIATPFFIDGIGTNGEAQQYQLPIAPGTLSVSGTVDYCPDSTAGHVENVTLTLTGGAFGSTTSDVSGAYQLSPLIAGQDYVITPTKVALSPGTAGIDTVDAMVVQRDYLGVESIPPGCGLMAADVNGDTRINTVDVYAIQRFFIGRTFGTANVGKYQFNPASRTYPGLSSDQIDQNYDALVLGDVASGFVHRSGRPSQAAGNDLDFSTVATVALPEITVDSPKSNFIGAVRASAIDAKNKLVGFQGDFTFDERVVTFQSEPVQKAGLTGGNWNVSGNVLDGKGPVRTLRISAFSNDFTPLSGSGTLFELKMKSVSKATGAKRTQLIWAAPPDGFIFIDADLKTQKPGNASPGSITPSEKRK